MRLWWQEGTLQGHLLPPFKAWAGVWVIFIQGALLKLSLTPNPQQHFPEPRLACFHTGISQKSHLRGGKLHMGPRISYRPFLTFSEVIVKSCSGLSEDPGERCTAVSERSDKSSFGHGQT